MIADLHALTTDPGRAQDPLVSIVTPVYNGEPYLRECLESVMAQTYTNWELVILNNCSTDRSLEIAQQYAKQDNRVRLHNNREFLGMTRNHNTALGLASHESKYCKVLHADDRLFPNCLTQMVRIAEAHPSIGLVGAYCLYDTQVECDGLPYPSEFVPGKQLCRLILAEGLGVLLSPSCLLIRSDLVRSAGGAFYNESHIYADWEAALEVLQRADFGFVHQVLTYVRSHDQSATAQYAERLNTYLPAALDLLGRYGPACLPHEEFERHRQRALREYHSYLGRCVLRLKDKQFWQYHRTALSQMGYRLSWGRVVGALVFDSLATFLVPMRLLTRGLRTIRQRRSSPVLRLGG